MMPRSRAACASLPLAAATLALAACANTPPPGPSTVRSPAPASAVPPLAPTPKPADSAAALPSTRTTKPLVACAQAAPPMPQAAPDSITFTQVLDAVGRLDVFAVGGRVLFGRMGRATSGNLGPNAAYLNRFYELEGTKIKVAKGLQKGLWDDFHITSIEGEWPHAVTLRGTNYGNTAWEQTLFRWNPTAGAWETKQDGGRAWPGGYVITKQWFATQKEPENFALVPSGGVLGIPDDLFANIPEGSASAVLAPSRDVYSRKNPCDEAGKNCDTRGVYHWCAPRTAFEAIALPDVLVDAAMVAVPGSAFVFDADDGYLVRDSVVTKVTPPDPKLKRHWVIATGGAIFYLGQKGLFRLENDGFRRLFAWSRSTETGEEILLPGQPRPVALTGFLARGPAAFLFTTWDGKRSQVWSNMGGTLAL